MTKDNARNSLDHHAPQTGARRNCAVVLLPPEVRPPGDLMLALHEWDTDIHIARSAVAAMGLLARLRASHASAIPPEKDTGSTRGEPMTILLVAEPDEWADLDDLLQAAQHYHPRAFFWGFRSQASPAIHRLVRRARQVDSMILPGKDATACVTDESSTAPIDTWPEDGEDSPTTTLNRPLNDSEKTDPSACGKWSSVDNANPVEREDDETPIPFTAFQPDDESGELRMSPTEFHADQSPREVNSAAIGNENENAEEPFEEVVAPPIFDRSPQSHDAERELEEHFPFLPRQQLRLAVPEYDEIENDIHDMEPKPRAGEHLEDARDATMVTEEELAMLLGDSEFEFDDDSGNGLNDDDNPADADDAQTTIGGSVHERERGGRS